MRVRLSVLLTVFVLLLAVLVPGALAQGPTNFPALPKDFAQGSLASQQFVPFRPMNPNYRNIKAAIDARAPRQGSGNSAATPLIPAVLLSWAGIPANGSSPSDANGAIGPDRYIEAANTYVAIWPRTGGGLTYAPLQTWSGIAGSYSDPVVEWSPHDNRFYAVMINISGSTYTIVYGFSKTSSPTAVNSTWCFYKSSFGGRYGSNIPDYPKLGDTADFMLFGVNVFNNAGTAYLGSDVAWVQKPAVGAITTCPAQTSLATGTIQNIKNADNSPAFTPNPAKQTDSSSTGYIVADRDPGGASSSFFSVFTLTKSGTTPVLSAPTSVNVSSYSYPPSAPQPGTADVLDTLDARFNSAWVAPDPSHGVTAIWTGHTVAASSGGLGAEYRWYEINGATGALVQSGKVQSTSLYVFMGAISPDRNGTTAKFGSNAVMAFNTSSSTSIVSAATASVVGGVQSGIVNVFTSPASDKDFTCTAPFGPPCRWGDYSGASPDPASTTTGYVWASVMTNGSTGNPSWTTRNFAVRP